MYIGFIAKYFTEKDIHPIILLYISGLYQYTYFDICFFFCSKDLIVSTKIFHNHVSPEAFIYKGIEFFVQCLFLMQDQQRKTTLFPFNLTEKNFMVAKLDKSVVII